jgi:hypothetical protein
MNNTNVVRASVFGCRIASVLAVLLLAANAFGQGATDKVTGEYTRANCDGCQPGDELKFFSYRLLSAHEASRKHPQKGFMFAVNDAGKWFGWTSQIRAIPASIFTKMVGPGSAAWSNTATGRRSAGLSDSTWRITEVPLTFPTTAIRFVSPGTTTWWRTPGSIYSTGVKRVSCQTIR